jgi:hypothetical protein
MVGIGGGAFGGDVSSWFADGGPSIFAGPDPILTFRWAAATASCCLLANRHGVLTLAGLLSVSESR